MNKIKKNGSEFCFLCLVSVFAYTKPTGNGKIIRPGNREVVSMNEGWRFARYGLQADGTRLEEPEEMQADGWDDSKWETVDIPHDFAITGPFRMDLSGNTGRLPFKGIGWYRKSFTLNKTDVNKRIYVDFDGVMAYAKVWLNGQYVGTWPYGYNSFRLDLTPYIKVGRNTLTVRTDTEKWDSRWYAGAGIYRNVWLVKTGDLHVKHWSARVTTDMFTEKSVRLNLSLEVENHSDKKVRTVIESDVYELDISDQPGKRVIGFPHKKMRLSPGTSEKLTLQEVFENYKRWDILSPNRYLARVTVKVNGKTTDIYDVPFGIREIAWSREGFFLNGRKVFLKGVCLHHDLGALGSAFNISAAERQLRIMQEMGCNAIRTSHNPPAPELLDLADKKGLLVMDEAFDTWAKGKREWDYNKLYDEWHEKDLRAMVCRDWNHPSIVFWSIGNEVMEQKNTEMTRHLSDIVRKLDNTRPITAGYNNPDGGRQSGAAKALDVMGVNYKFRKQAEWDKDEYFKHMPTIGTETSSCLSTRGVYFEGDTLRKNWQISSYDQDSPGWGCTPDKQFAINARFPYLMGEFVWTGFDYLGEPTPFNSDNTNLLNFRADPGRRTELKKELEKLEQTQPPSRSSYFGIVDLAGFPKDRYYLYQSHWRAEIPMVHILPHWNWPTRIGKPIPVHVYTSGTEVELFINGKSYGRKTKEKDKVYRLVWDSVTYYPGTVKAIYGVSYHK